MEEEIIEIDEDGKVHLPWKMIEIDRKKFKVPVEVATLLRNLLEERDAALDWMRFNGIHKAECIVADRFCRCECGLIELIGNS